MLILFDHGPPEASPGFFTVIGLWKPSPEVGTALPTARIPEARRTGTGTNKGDLNG